MLRGFLFLTSFQQNNQIKFTQAFVSYKMLLKSLLYLFERYNHRHLPDISTHMKYSIAFFSVFFLFTVACDETTPKEKRELITTDHHLEKPPIKTDSVYKTKKVYVPVYSDIYQRTRNERTLLTSTLSIHNTSETDTLYISRIDYYNTEGKFVRKYLESTIFLNTFETLEYVVDEEDKTGGSGANFVIEWYGNEKLNPIFQGIMLGGLGNKSFSFTTEGVEVY